jgi:hypothetical protein
MAWGEAAAAESNDLALLCGGGREGCATCFPDAGGALNIDIEFPIQEMTQHVLSVAPPGFALKLREQWSALQEPFRHAKCSPIGHIPDRFFRPNLCNLAGMCLHRAPYLAAFECAFVVKLARLFGAKTLSRRLLTKACVVFRVAWPDGARWYHCSYTNLAHSAWRLALLRLSDDGDPFRVERARPGVALTAPVRAQWVLSWRAFEDLPFEHAFTVETFRLFASASDIRVHFRIGNLSVRPYLPAVEFWRGSANEQPRPPPPLPPGSRPPDPLDDIAGRRAEVAADDGADGDSHDSGDAACDDLLDDMHDLDAVCPPGGGDEGGGQFGLDDGGLFGAVEPPPPPPAVEPPPPPPAPAPPAPAPPGAAPPAPPGAAAAPHGPPPPPGPAGDWRTVQVPGGELQFSVRLKQCNAHCKRGHQVGSARCKMDRRLKLEDGRRRFCLGHLMAWLARPCGDKPAHDALKAELGKAAHRAERISGRNDLEAISLEDSENGRLAKQLIDMEREEGGFAGEPVAIR